MKKLFLFLTLLFNFSQGSVYAQANQPVNFISTMISRLAIHDFNGDLLIYTQNSTINPANCPTSGFYVVSRTNPNFQQIFSLAMMAQTTQRQVTGWVFGCSTTGYTGVPYLIRLDVYS